MTTIFKIFLLSSSLFLFIACGVMETDDTSKFTYPLADTLRINHIQMKGTHNSYHIAPAPFLGEGLEYTLPLIDIQLNEQGVRQFELDVYYDRKNENENNRFRVYHIPVIDEGSTCYWLADCLEVLYTWSKANSGHHPIFVFIEPKNIEGHYEELDAEILMIWPGERIITPDDVKGEYPDLPQALSDRGWPTLGESRGRAIFVMLDSGLDRTNYTHNDTSLDGRVMFVLSDIDSPYAAVMKIDDPIAGEDKIREAAQAGLLIRTRADSVWEPREEDTTRLEAALRSGAHMISTDYPAEGMIENYWVEIPDGTPSRCNPVTAPTECTSKAIEDPAKINSK